MKLLALLIFMNSGFVVDVATEASYTIDLERELLAGFVDDIGLFERHMPGVVRVKSIGENIYLYQTAKQVPLAGTLRTDFTIARRTEGDSLTVYESLSPDDQNYMYCAVLIKPEAERTTRISITLRLRLVRENGFAIHWMAPLLGEAFIESRMKEEMDDMLNEFIESSNRELYNRLLQRTMNE